MCPERTRELLARPRGFEPLTFAFGGQRSIQLSYGRLMAALITQAVRRGNARFAGGWRLIAIYAFATSSKNAITSRASASGCSSAAKWPPFGIRVQRRMFA
jgi:hypothetical protein